MKRLIIFSAFVFALGFITTLEAKQNNLYVGDYFYTELAPYGRWIEIDYGVVVWKPTVMQVSWLPYRMGRWIWTYDGWYWDSYEPFGYITYHYGRWFYDDYYGWLWYPDYEWAPAWVEWRYSNNHIGWAPLHPYATFSISFGIRFTQVYNTPYHHWHFVKFNYFCDPYPYNYYVAPTHRYRVYQTTRYRTNYRYYNGRVQNRGVNIDYVRVRSNQEIRRRDIVRVRDKRELSRNGDKNKIRTLDLKRDELVRNDLKRMDIQRDNRRTKLDHTKIDVGRKDRTRTTVKKDRNVKLNKRNDVKITRDNKKQTVRKEVRNKDVQRKDVKRNDNVNVKKNRNKNTVNRNDVNKRINDQKKTIKKRTNTQTNKSIRTDTNKKRFEPKVNKQKTQIKKDNRTKKNKRTQVNVNRNKTNKKTNVTRNHPPVKRKETRVNKNERKVQTNRTMVKDKNRERRKR
ncbi:MAG: hypothetical protein KJN64_07600 [Ignavibacteria bacterium]|nr:hypothetical protein [Ignavibacteria bacterium]